MRQKIGSPDARKIVAELYWRERHSKKCLKKAIMDARKNTHGRIYIAAVSGQWAEAHNAAVTAKKILLGIDLG